jgi:hypothetical protein
MPQHLTRSTWIALTALAALACAAPALADDAPKPAANTKTKPAAAPADAVNDIDWQKARALFRRFQAGEKLTPDEQAYLDRARGLRRRGVRPNQPNNARPAAAPLLREPLDQTPLTEFSAEQTYKGFDGGLYGHGRNTPPEAHLTAAMKAVHAIQPLDADGHPARDGKVVMISNGMSNTTQEFSQFMRLAEADKSRSAHLVIVDGAQGGQEAFEWTRPRDPDANGRPSPWDVLMQRLERAGVSAKQVQVVWIKQARRNPASLGEFPEHARELQGRLATLVRMLKERFPNLRVAYLSSRIYAGYARSALNPEPYAFEGAFSVRWLIEDQIAGKPELNFDRAKGDVKAPLLLWGPYLWANGQRPRKADGLTYAPADLGPDGTHPSPAGRIKVANQLLNFFKTDPTARPWFTGSP